VSLLEGGAGPAIARLELPTAEADLVLIGPPSVLTIVTRGVADDGASCHRLVLHQPPYLEAGARVGLEGPVRVAAGDRPPAADADPGGARAAARAGVARRQGGHGGARRRARAVGAGARPRQPRRIRGRPRAQPGAVRLAAQARVVGRGLGPPAPAHAAPAAAAA